MRTMGRWIINSCQKIRGAIQHIPQAEIEALCNDLPVDADFYTLQTWLERAIPACGLESIHWLDSPAATELPMLAVIPGEAVYVLTQYQHAQGWGGDGQQGFTYIKSWPVGTKFAALYGAEKSTSSTTAKGMINSIFFADKEWLWYASIVAILGNVLALGASLFSMQVYDRVIPSNGISTLVVLTIGVGFLLVLELTLKLARSSIVQGSLCEVDRNIAYRIFERLTKLRIDQFPPTVGVLSGQLRGYEQIRNFLSSIVLYATTDVPFALFFLVAIVFIGGHQMAIVPAIFLVITILVGLACRYQIKRAAQVNCDIGNRKLGLLVEAVNGAESIKAYGAGWQFLLNWNQLNRESIQQESKMRHLVEQTQYATHFLQQVSYALLIAMGAYLATQGGVTMGTIVACSILSGRVLQPIAQIPGLITQWAHAKAAYTELEHVFSLQTDNHGVSRPIAPPHVRGEILIDDVKFSYGPDLPPIAIKDIHIPQGQKVALLGAIGSGKSTLIRLLAGIYRAQQGTILIDGLDIHQICRTRLSEIVGYLPQDVQLFHGTLRDNLLWGLSHRDDNILLDVSRKTGLINVISSHPHGLDMEISEGGGGLSGGQRQLIGLTRLLIVYPAIWLLDEPTASMDANTEGRCLDALRTAMKSEQTAVIVTHKPALLALVDRVIVLGPNGKVILDGERDAVISALTQRKDNNNKEAASIEQK